ncbi:MAG: tRNA pseudouridine(38-40) synthase TruA [Flavisolibacter sp.]
MPRYFIELAYDGSNYSGFQIQENANTVQAEIEKAFQVIHRERVSFTGSSRTDSGVHCLQNFFHFDFENELHPQFIYKMNALLPLDIVVKKLHKMNLEAHCRFDAISREYIYRIHRFKDPFIKKYSFFYPYKLDLERMHKAAEHVKSCTNFYGFSKTNTQVTNFNCQVQYCTWSVENNELIFTIRANRFLRGMVRLLTGSCLKMGRHKLTLEEFKELFIKNEKCAYSVPAHGLFLRSVNYPENYFPATGGHFTAF